MEEIEEIFGPNPNIVFFLASDPTYPIQLP
jgi:hypothetical protein